MSIGHVLTFPTLTMQLLVALFCHQYSSLAKAGRGDAAEPVEGRGTSVGITQLRDFAIQWVRTDAAEPWVSQTGAGASWAAAATAARILL